MPTIKETILVLIKEGVFFYLSDPCRYFKKGGHYQLGTYYSALRRLEKEGKIEKVRAKEKKIHLQLTEKGRKFIKEHREAGRRYPRRWDNKWRIVIFDIPEQKRSARDRLRRYLKTLGFGKVQRSIWLSPYDFTELVSRYATELKLSKYLFQIQADDFKEISDAELVEKIWNINKINRQYLNLIKKYRKRKAELSPRSKKKTVEDKVSRKILRGNLIWDFQSIQAQDPHLPPEFLPLDWGGEKAKKFIDDF